VPRLLWFLADEVRIVPCATNPGIWSSPDRVIGLAILGTTPRADEMPGHLRHRHAVGQPQTTLVRAAGLIVLTIE
jgi:hypothetical protein